MGINSYGTMGGTIASHGSNWGKGKPRDTMLEERVGFEGGQGRGWL
jgi:hypothetical protein